MKPKPYVGHVERATEKTNIFGRSYLPGRIASLR